MMVSVRAGWNGAELNYRGSHLELSMLSTLGVSRRVTSCSKQFASPSGAVRRVGAREDPQAPQGAQWPSWEAGVLLLPKRALL